MLEAIGLKLEKMKVPKYSNMENRWCAMALFSMDRLLERTKKLLQENAGSLGMCTSELSTERVSSKLRRRGARSKIGE